METVPEGFPWLPLWEGRTTGIVVRPGHPLEALYEKTGRVTESDVIRYGFVEVTWRPTTYYRLTQSRLSPLLSERNIVIKTPYFMGAAKIISESNLVMLLSGHHGGLVHQFGRAAAHSGCFRRARACPEQGIRH